MKINFKNYKAHFEYLRYVIAHKYYVFTIGKKLNLSLKRRLLHDMSKFSASEWFPYVSNFYNDDGTKKQVRDSSGYYDPKTKSDEFQKSWLHHAHNNKHHWQYWVLVDFDENKVLEMPKEYIKEMITDWCSAGKVQHNQENPTKFYNLNKDKMIFDSSTRLYVEFLLKKHFGDFVGQPFIN
jgi:hypothetical protein